MFQFTHLGRGATGLQTQILKLRVVSIHAPREGCDNTELFCEPCIRSFNSRTSGGVRLLKPIPWCSASTFQFTHLGRGATIEEACRMQSLSVSIHAPREGCDIVSAPLGTSRASFNSRTSGGVRPSGITSVNALKSSFNSRTSGGVRPTTAISATVPAMFQFTHLGRGATVWCKVAYYGADKQA